MNILEKVIIALLKGTIRLYQLLLSPYLGSNCRFHPTCSEYALQALSKNGFPQGFFQTIRRLSRCHPWSGQAGHDPVP